MGILRLIMERIGLNFRIESGQFTDNLEAVRDKRIDALMDVTPIPDGEKFLNFTDRYIEVPHVIIARKNGPYLKSEEDLNGMTIGLEKNFGNVRYFHGQADSNV